jgi:hypothetical protein
VTPDKTAAPATGRLLLDVFALLLIVAGVIGLNVAAFTLTPVLGVAAVSVTAIAAGVGLGQAR